MPQVGRRKIERLAILFPFQVVDVRDLPEKFCPEGYVAPAVAETREAAVLPDVGAGASADPADVRLPRDGLNLKEHLADLEVNLIRQALSEADGVVAHAAKLLSMRRTTLVEKLRKYGLQRGDDMS